MMVEQREDHQGQHFKQSEEEGRRTTGAYIFEIYVVLLPGGDDRYPPSCWLPGVSDDDPCSVILPSTTTTSA